MVSEDFLNTLLMVGVILIAVYLVLKELGLGDLLVGLRGTRRVRVQEEPRDQAERWLTNQRKVGVANVPKVLKSMAILGDLDVPGKPMGKVKSITPHQEGYLVFTKRKLWEWSKPHIIPRELCSDLNRRVLMVRSRGFTTNGLYRIPVPLTRDPITPDLTQSRCRRLFRLLFGLQVLVDAEEDAAWAQATAMMPRVKDRKAMAEVEVPHLVDRPYASEDQVVGR